MTLIEELNEFPPILCRILARKDRRCLTTTEIATLAGMSKQKAGLLLARNTWADISVRDASALMWACGITRANRFRVREFLKRNANSRNPFRHMARLDRQQVASIEHALKAVGEDDKDQPINA